MKGINPFVGGNSLKSSLLPLLAIFALGISSCMPENNQPLPGSGVVSGEAITLSQNELTFAQDGGAQSVTVSGAETWNFISSVGEDGWLKLSQDGSDLAVVVEPNPSGDVRSASVLVTGPTSQAKLTITQTQADFVIDFSDSEVTIPANGGEKVVFFKSNAQSFTVDPVPADITWLTMSEGSGAIVLNAQPNTGNESRVANLTITSANGEKRALTVTQLGVQKYYIAYEVLDPDTYRAMDIILFEQSRGNLVVGFAEPQEAEPFPGYFQFYPGYINVVTASDTSNKIVYNYGTLESGNTGYTDAQIPVYYSDPDTKPEMQEYIDYLKANGFTQDEDVETMYLSPARKMKVTIIDAAPAGLVAKYEPNFIQPPYPTWEEMPKGAIQHNNFDFIRNADVKAQNIKDMEAPTGSTLMQEAETALVFDATKTDSEEGYRFYYLAPTEQYAGQVGGGAELVGSVIQFDLFFGEELINKAMWFAGSEYIVTDEFGDLLTANGYKFLGSQQGLQQYYRELEDGLIMVLMLSVIQDDMVFSGAPTLRMSRIILPGQGVTGSVHNYTLREIFDGKAGDINLALMTPAQRSAWDIFTANTRNLFGK